MSECRATFDVDAPKHQRQFPHKVLHVELPPVHEVADGGRAGEASIHRDGAGIAARRDDKADDSDRELVTKLLSLQMVVSARDKPWAL